MTRCGTAAWGASGGKQPQYCLLSLAFQSADNSLSRVAGAQLSGASAGKETSLHGDSITADLVMDLKEQQTLGPHSSTCACSWELRCQ